jgi:c-di-GMP-binding flagellar brake protein YcgR
MSTQEKRRNYRIDSLNLISYACQDENGNLIQQGMGRTLNVSETGLLLETHTEIESQYPISLTIGLEDDLVEIKGQIVHSKKNQEGKFESGIRFFELDEQSRVLLTIFIKAFRGQ